jgi:hypothetical protein
MDTLGLCDPGGSAIERSRPFPARIPRRRFKVRCSWILTRAACLLMVTSAGAGEIASFKLEPQGDGYRLQSRGLIEAPRDAVWQVLGDYAALHEVSPRILESELVSVSADGVVRVRTLNRLCFLAFCHNLRHVQLIRALGYGDFESNSVAEESDLSRGYARWRLHDRGAVTELDIDFKFAMDSYSWVPSFVTRFVARSALKADARELVEGIERVARSKEKALRGD